jgi:hypothetical protein
MCRDSFNDADQGWSMGFTCSEPTHLIIIADRRCFLLIVYIYVSRATPRNINGANAIRLFTAILLNERRVRITRPAVIHAKRFIRITAENSSWLTER